MALGPVAIAGPKAGLWRDHESGEGGDLFTLIERFRGCEFAEAAAFAADMVGGAVIEPREPVKKAKRLDDERSRTEYALCLWQASRSITGTLAAIYLTELRRVDITQLPDIDDVLRFHPDCPFGIGERYPCLLALMRNVVTDAPTGIIRTAISTCGEKLGRKMLGRKQGAAVKLWPDTAVTTGLVVGEGVETVASAATRIEYRGARLQPAWALCDAGNLTDFTPLPGIEFLTIVADNDASSTGQRAAEACVRRWLAAGQVEILLPHKLGNDFADLAAEVAA